MPLRGRAAGRKAAPLGALRSWPRWGHALVHQHGGPSALELPDGEADPQRFVVGIEREQAAGVHLSHSVAAAIQAATVARTAPV